MKLVAYCLAASAAVLAATVACAQEAADDPRDIIVTGSVYRGEVASGGARIDVPTKDLPLSISVLTNALIEDRQVRNLRDLADNVAGVRSRQSGSGAFSVGFTIRGLQGIGGSVTAVNGFRVESFSSGFDPQAVDRVEFLKGPASVLYGASGALSGLVNVVTKVPQSTNFVTLEAIGGTPTYGRGTVDANVRLAQNLDSRTNLAVTNDEVLNAFRRVNEQFAMQSLRWHPADFSIIVEGSVFHSDGPSREGTQYPELARFFQLSKRFKTGEKWDQDVNFGYTGRLDASWKVTPNFTLRQGVHYQYYREHGFDVTSYSGTTFQSLIAPDVLARGIRRDDGTTRYVVTQTEARWTVRLGPTTHKLLAGFEYGHEDFGGFCCDTADIAPLDLNNPVYGTPRPNIPLTQYYANVIDTKALYIQDYIEWRRLKLLAGLRHDDTASSSAYCDTTVAGCPSDPVVANLGDARKKAFSPRLGLAWQPTDRTTVFVSWSKSFNPNTVLDINNRLLPPEFGIQYEAGFRQDLIAPGRLTLSGSIFRLTRRNIADCDPSTLPTCDRYIAIGEQRIKGAELELAGKPVEWIDLIATYSYIYGRVTKSNVATSGIPVGSKLPETAPNSASLFAKVTLKPLGLPKVALSGGVYYVDSRPTRNYFFGPFSANAFSPTVSELPSSTRVDLGAYWEMTDAFRLQANITNVFDTAIYEPVNAGFNRSQPFRATIGARVTL